MSGITVLGMMGEAQKMSGDESEAFLAHMLARVNRQVPIVVGVSNPGLHNLVRLSKMSMDNGAAGVMIAPLTGLATEEKIYKYFEQVFAELGSDVPGLLPGLSFRHPFRHLRAVV